MNRCALCPGIHTPLPPSGPPGRILFVGEAPGKQEQAKKCVFIGKTGEEVNRHYLPLANLRRDEVRFINAIACLPPGPQGKLDPKRQKDLDLLSSCASCHLYPEIERTKPALIVPMGNFACKVICPDIHLELQHGIPCETPWGIPAFPMYHPALGIHEPKKMLHIRTDWIRLRQYLRGQLPVRTDQHPHPDYAEVQDVSELGTFTLDPALPLACDTESKKERTPYCLTFSQQPGTGRLIRAERTDLIQAFAATIITWRGPILFHNWLYDRPVTRAMGLLIPDVRVIDTMLWAFHLGNLPQGLKALAYRELGMTMQDFDDLVTPYSTQRVLDYYRQAASFEWQKPPEELVVDAEGKWKLYRPQSMSTKFKRFFTDYSKNPEKDVFSMWEDNWEPHHAEIEEKCGPWPGKCITHAPFDRVLHYACRDADALLRLYPILRGMRGRTMQAPQERWRDGA